VQRTSDRREREQRYSPDVGELWLIDFQQTRIAHVSTSLDRGPTTTATALALGVEEISLGAEDPSKRGEFSLDIAPLPVIPRANIVWAVALLNPSASRFSSRSDVRRKAFVAAVLDLLLQDQAAHVPDLVEVLLLGGNNLSGSLHLL
jgi:hypothetical protein